MLEIERQTTEPATAQSIEDTSHSEGAQEKTHSVSIHCFSLEMPWPTGFEYVPITQRSDKGCLVNCVRVCRNAGPTGLV